MDVIIGGARGSMPPSGPQHARRGTATSAVAFARDDEPPRLILDAGTGLANLSRRFAGAPFEGTIALGHLHWDHLFGLPFFPAGRHRDSKVEVLVPTDGDPVEVLAGAMGPPFFPLRPDELPGTWRFRGFGEGHWSIEGFDVTARSIPHLDGATFGFRVTDGTRTVAYLSDHQPQALGAGDHGWGVLHPAARELAAGADLLIHDAQLTAAELEARGYLGHAAAEYAVELGVAAGARRVLLFHHDPWRSDDEIDEIERRLSSSEIDVVAATEGAVIRL